MSQAAEELAAQRAAVVITTKVLLNSGERPDAVRETAAMIKEILESGPVSATEQMLELVGALGDIAAGLLVAAANENGVPAETLLAEFMANMMREEDHGDG